MLGESCEPQRLNGELCRTAFYIQVMSIRNPPAKGLSRAMTLTLLGPQSR
jgi:hypothetical protein